MSVDQVVLLDRGGLRLSLSKDPDPAAVDLLCNTLWGSPGGIRYQHLDTKTGIGQLPNPAFLQLHKAENLLGVLALSNRRVQMASEIIQAAYIRYFAVRPSMQRKAVDDLERGQEVREGMLRKVARTFFDSPETLEELTGTACSGYYAYVTLDNIRSKAMCDSMGFHAVGAFKTHVFSRIFPRKHAHVRPIADAERDETAAWVYDTYKDHAFWPADLDWVGKDYWVVVEDGKVVAGARFRPVHWRMVEMPGWTGKFLIQALPRIPILRRLINPERFHFLAVDAIVCSRGKEAQFFKLLSHACAEHGLNSAMIWRDEKDEDWHRISGGGNWGFLAKLNHASSIHVIARGLPFEGKLKIMKNPIYIWPADVV